jgi:hypothetical protein
LEVVGALSQVARARSDMEAGDDAGRAHGCGSLDILASAKQGAVRQRRSGLPDRDVVGQGRTGRQSREHQTGEHQRTPHRRASRQHSKPRPGRHDRDSTSDHDPTHKCGRLKAPSMPPSSVVVTLRCARPSRRHSPSFPWTAYPDYSSRRGCSACPSWVSGLSPRCAPLGQGQPGRVGYRAPLQDSAVRQMKAKGRANQLGGRALVTTVSASARDP